MALKRLSLSYQQLNEWLSLNHTGDDGSMKAYNASLLDWRCKTSFKIKKTSYTYLLTGRLPAQ